MKTLEFTDEEWEKLVSTHNLYCEGITSTYPLDPRMVEYNRVVRQTVFKALRRIPGTLTGMALDTVLEMESVKCANLPYCRAR